jgi:hypothetical protein
VTLQHVCLIAAAILFGIAAYLDFARHPHAIGWACIGLAVLAVSGLFVAVRRPV